MQLDPHFSFNGNCAEALAFYAEVLGGEPKFQMTWAESPMAANVPADWQHKIMHGAVSVGTSTIMGADAPPGGFRPAGSTVTSIPATTPEEGRRIFDTLATGGSIQMPYAETFWARGFGMCTDRFGIPWMINCEKPMPTA